MDWKNITVSFGHAGLIAIGHDTMEKDRWYLHLGVSPLYWVFGPLNGLEHPVWKKIRVWGCGPLFLFFRCE